LRSADHEVLRALRGRVECALLCARFRLVDAPSGVALSRSRNWLTATRCAGISALRAGRRCSCCWEGAGHGQ
jgi:hypothetical protein